MSRVNCCGGWERWRVRAKREKGIQTHKPLESCIQLLGKGKIRGASLPLGIERAQERGEERKRLESQKGSRSVGVRKIKRKKRREKNDGEESHRKTSRGALSLANWVTVSSDSPVACGLMFILDECRLCSHRSRLARLAALFHGDGHADCL